MTDQPLRIDIVSDVVCPWCIVGFTQLRTALHEVGVQADIHWHPFELNPDMPPEGENLRDHIMCKYGSTAEQSRRARADLVDLGTDLGIPFVFTEDSRIVNTFEAHQLLHWSAQGGRQTDLKLALFDAYFRQGRDVSDRAVLLDAAEAAGLDRADAEAALSDPRLPEAVREKEEFWIARGIRGVPAMIFGRQHLVTGAQGIEGYRRVLDHLASNAA
ncbi:Predicted dithiol-disulfide isomerase, DsbA family [Salinihabitans flavidus]|uniref:Predicted dithiol-disulfide isomerase, DsbA family n=1 Tax=Salinihabitans flavidus TaxID=569882 RepID=A0A1H8U3J6_9RHOB|nr:DsbA family oxidoreductase [Salinihabitans flavidus]SEO97424.1 Predicted dithiol-disulfide isomerase, DsbA family [Salinihabitans flavidus]